MQDHTHLGSMAQLYLKTTDLQLKDQLKKRIIEEIEVGHKSLDKVATIFDTLATTNELDFVYDCPNLYHMVDEKSNYNTNRSMIRDNFGLHASTALNRAIEAKNHMFLQNLFTHLEKNSDKKEIFKSVKFALNHDMFEVLRLTEQKEAIKNYRTAYGQNMCYLATSIEGLDFLESEFALTPKSRAEWVEKRLYMQMKQTMALDVAAVVAQLKSYGVAGLDLEFYSKKKGHDKAPPVWIVIAQHPEIWPELKPYLRAGATDSQGNSLAYFVFDAFWKSAPNMQDSQTLNFISAEMKNFDLNDKNTAGVSALDKIQRIVDKKVNSASKKLEDFKLFCEKIIFQSHVSAPTTTSSRRHKL